MLQIAAQRDLLPRLSGIVIDGLLQLGQIVEPILLAAQAEHRLIAALIQHLRDQIGQIHLRIDGAVPFDQAHILLGTALPEQRRFHVLQKRRIEARIPRGGIFLQKRDARPSDAAARLVDRAQEGNIVAAVDHAQIAENVLDLLALVELHAAVEHIRHLLSDQRLFNGA